MPYISIKVMFENDRIRLRALEPEDLDWLYKVENDDTLWQCGNSNVPYSRYVLKNYLTTTSNDLYADGQLRLAIIDKEEQCVMGCVDLIDFTPRHQRAEIGIFLFETYRGKGYALEALNMLCSYARDFLFVHLLYAVVSIRNKSAIKLFERADFKCKSTLNDWLRNSYSEYEDALLYSRLLF